MHTDADYNSSDRSKADEPDTIGGVLASALKMENDISSGVYYNYTHRQHWPKQLDDELFCEIEARLTVLIEDTKKHQMILQALVEEHARDA